MACAGRGPSRLIAARRVEKAVISDDGFEKKGGYPAGQKPTKGVPPVPAGLRKPRTPPPQGKRPHLRQFPSAGDRSSSDGTQPLPEQQPATRREGLPHWRGIPRGAEADERRSARTCGAEDTPHPTAAEKAPHLRQFPSAGGQVARRWRRRCLAGTVTGGPAVTVIHRH